MIGRALLAVLAVFVAWSVLDFVIHGNLLLGIYQETAELWRPEEEMKYGLMSGVTLLVAAAFVAIYAWLISDKRLITGIRYGTLFGLASGISMGYGTYCYMPIPYKLALGWMVGTLVEAVVAGLLVGLIVRDRVTTMR